MYLLTVGRLVTYSRILDKTNVKPREVPHKLPSVVNVALNVKVILIAVYFCRSLSLDVDGNEVRVLLKVRGFLPC
jgi:hypothetical protein